MDRDPKYPRRGDLNMMHSVSAQRDWFPATRWSVVRRAGGGSSPSARRALAELCETYWVPLYAYVRHRGNSPHDAQDLTQGFFATFLATDALCNVRSDQGRFRAFLLACLKHCRNSCLAGPGERRTVRPDDRADGLSAHEVADWVR